ncbi:response regulator [Caldithrix abyssi]|nr:response regulator [Caldithrix abyssi]
MKKILVVDDDDLIRDLLFEILEDKGYKVFEAENGNRAIQLLKTERFDLIITDIIMPDKEGIETIIDIKKRLPHAKIIAMSGGGQLDATSYLSVAKKLGVQHTISKPFDPGKLIALIEDLLGE